jgi:hypothetical protein
MLQKVFISQPMRGKSEEEIRVEREKCERQVAVLFPEGYEILQSYRPEWGAELREGGYNPVFFLGKSLQILSEANYAFFAPGWGDNAGCTTEHDVCVRYGIPTNT